MLMYQLSMIQDPRPECADVAAPTFRYSVPTKPDCWCNQYFDAIANSCDSQGGQDKEGEARYARCVVCSSLSTGAQAKELIRGEVAEWQSNCCRRFETLRLD